MRIHPFLLTISLSFSLVACKKNSSDNTVPPGNHHNEFKATIKSAGQSDISILSTGNTTIFSRYIEGDGDTVITVLGSDNDRQVSAVLGNISAVGTYNIIDEAATINDRFSLCSYLLGNPLAPTKSYYTEGNPAAGTITITSITSSHITGSFDATFLDPAGDIHIKATFNGGF